MNQYREVVGAFILNKQKQLFLAKRKQSSTIPLSDFNANSIATPPKQDIIHDSTIKTYWQLPQGGIEKDEKLEQALMREIKEEIGTNNCKILAQANTWYSYDFPQKIANKIYRGNFKGQKIMWFCLEFLGDDSEIDLFNHPEIEFEQWSWCAPRELIPLAIEFKQPMYKQILIDFQRFYL